MKATSGAHSQHALAYHQDCEILAIETEVDHVHVLVRLKPIHNVAKIVQYFKGSTAFQLFREYCYVGRLRLGLLAAIRLTGRHDSLTNTRYAPGAGPLIEGFTGAGPPWAVAFSVAGLGTFGNAPVLLK